MDKQKQLGRASLALSAPVVGLLVLIVFVLATPTGALSTIEAFLIGFLLLVAIPVIPILHASKKGWIDIEISDKDQRAGFFLNAFCGYASAAIVYQIMYVHTLAVLSAAYAFVTGAFILVNKFWKISAHTAGTAGPTTALLWVFGPVVIPLYALTAVVVWLRLRLGAHTLMQTLAGAALSIAITIATYAVFY